MKIDVQNLCKQQKGKVNIDVQNYDISPATSSTALTIILNLKAWLVHN